MGRISTKRLIFFDLETTGLDPERDAIIQIAAVAVDENLRAIDTFEVKVKFDVSAASPIALQVNSYDEGKWEKEAVPDGDALTAFSSFMKKHATIRRESKKGKPFFVAQLAAYNSAFDGPFLRAWFERRKVFLPASYLVLCVMQRAEWYFLERRIKPPENFKLESVCRRLKVRLIDAHDALGDVRATAQLYRRLVFRGKRRSQGGRVQVRREAA